MVVVVSGSGITVVGILEETVVVIVGSGAGPTIVGRLEGKVLVVGRGTGATVEVMVVGTGAGVNRSIMIRRENSENIFRDDSSCCSFQ